MTNISLLHVLSQLINFFSMIWIKKLVELTSNSIIIICVVNFLRLDVLNKIKDTSTNDIIERKTFGSKLDSTSSYW